jgi:hypothetical protein
MNIVLAEWRCHGENALEHDRDLEDDGVKKVKPSAWLKQDVCNPEHLRPEWFTALGPMRSMASE